MLAPLQYLMFVLFPSLCRTPTSLPPYKGTNSVEGERDRDIGVERERYTQNQKQREREMHMRKKDQLLPHTLSHIMGQAPTPGWTPYTHHLTLSPQQPGWEQLPHFTGEKAGTQAAGVCAPHHLARKWWAGNELWLSDSRNHAHLQNYT